MSSSSGKIYKLRKINRALFDQLESNSVLLESRLKKLKECARSSKDFMACQSTQSPTEEKQKPWKLKNDSGQVSEVLNAELNLQFTSSDSTSQEEILQGDEKTKNLAASPSIKSKRKRLEKGTKSSFKHYHNPHRVSQKKGDLENESPNSAKDASRSHDQENEKFYNKPNSAKLNNPNLRKLTDKEENVSLSKHKTFNICSGKSYMPHGSNDKLQEVGNLINYTPKSKFLKKLKEHLQRSPRKTVYIKSQTPSTVTSSSNTLMQVMKRTPVSVKNTQKSSLKEGVSCTTVANSCSFACCGCSTSTYECASNNIANSLVKANEDLPLKQKKKNKFKKKRVCYRRNCYCRRTQQGASSVNKKTSAKKEKLPLSAKEVRNPNASLYSCTKCCYLGCRHSAHKLYHAPLGHSSSVRTPQETYCCTCQERGSWFNALKEFRDSHWFDCHAKPINVCSDTNEHNKLQNHCNCYQQDQHTCVHQYVVNDRLFMQPVCTDHKGRSRCLHCSLPRSKERTSVLPQYKTEPSKEEVLVSIPLSMLSSEKKKTHSQEELLKRSYKRSVRQKKSPPPANSLALRFQKGIL